MKTFFLDARQRIAFILVRTSDNRAHYYRVDMSDKKGTAQLSRASELEVKELQRAAQSK